MRNNKWFQNLSDEAKQKIIDEWVQQKVEEEEKERNKND